MRDGTRTIFLTRPASARLISQFDGRATVESISVIETTSRQLTKDEILLLQALASGRFGFVVFTSDNGVRWSEHHLRAVGSVIPNSVKIIAQGASTAQVVRQVFGREALIPPQFIGESVADYLLGIRKGHEEVLLLVAAKTRGVIARTLKGAGVKVEQVCVYETRSRDFSDTERERMRAHLQRSLVVCFSPSAVDTLAQYFPAEASEASYVTIGPVTSDAVRRIGARVVGEASDHSEEGVIAILESLLER